MEADNHSNNSIVNLAQVTKVSRSS